MGYQEAVAEAAGALQRGEDANWELARLTHENTNTQEDRSRITMEKWCADVALASGRNFARETGRKYAKVHREHGTKVPRLSWTEAWYETVPRDTHPKVAERGAKYTAEKGDPEAAAGAVRIALNRPEVADIVIADTDTNRNVTHARHRHDEEATAVGEAKDPERRDARHNTEQRDVVYRLVKFRNWLFNTTGSVQEWVWTPELITEFEDALDGVDGALNAFRIAPNIDKELADLLKGEQ